MLRKIIKIGENTLVVSLPKEWVDLNNLKKGDLLNAEFKDEDLTISVKQELKKRESKIFYLKIEDNEFFNPRDLTKPYLLGYSEIHIQYQDRSILSTIQEEIADLLGFEITHTDEKSIIIKNVSEGIDQEIENMIQRLIFLLISTGEDILRYVHEGEKEKLRSLLANEKDSNRLSLFCRRIINKGDYRGDKNPYIIYTMSSLLEAAIDEYRFIIDYILEKDVSLLDETLKEYFDYVNRLSRDLYNLYKDFNNKRFFDIRRERKSRERYMSEKEKKTEHPYIFHKLYNVHEMIHHMTYF